MTDQSSTQTASARHIGRTTLYFFGALGGILFGYDLGVISGVLPFIGKLWALTSWDKGVITASLSVGAIVGALLSSRTNEALGRRRTIMVAAGIVIVGTLAASFSPTFLLLVLSRLIIGLGIGLSSSTVPTYLSELAPAKWRGAMGALNQIFIVLGILIAFLVSYWLGPISAWRWMFAGAIVPAVILLIGLVFLPETPRWLVKNGQEDEARRVLASAHGSTVNLDEEIATIHEVIRLDTEEKPRIRDLFSGFVRPMIVVALLLAIGQQFSGVNAINAYFPTMLIGLGFATQAALLSGVLLGVTKFLFTAWVVFVVDRWGRKPLLLIGNVIMVVTLVAAGLVVLNVHDTGTRGLLMLVMMVLYLVGYELGWGAVVWVMMSEVFPLKYRATGMGVSSVVLWAATGIVSAVFPIISDPKSLGIGGSMFLFAGVNVVLFVLTKWLVPETKGRSLEQIELDLRARQGVAAKS
ncbi:sugar porter family MFS transporter [Amycolatopsis sp. NPDC024027]|uniref:sugar porter family MFS transporter n=1 Tax=Amycolatopsis sp. NPDC024027 TaxID=3154327 RepID=UPI0033E0695F